jgi:hypothetical protein
VDALHRQLAGIRLIAGRHSARVWLLWAVVGLVLVVTPFALLDPAAWLFVLDPELAAVVVLVGMAGIRSGALRASRLLRCRS